MSYGLAPDFPVLIVDDDEAVVQSMIHVLKSDGISNVFGFEASLDAMEFIDNNDAGIVLVDLNMPIMSGKELLTTVEQNRPEILVAVVTGDRELERAIECMRLGAADYLLKPVEASRLIGTVRRLIEYQELRRENTRIKERMLAASRSRHPAFARVVTSDPRMESLMKYAEAIAPTPHPVLITGETGVGKELFARAVHELSGRKGEFVPVNVAGLDDNFFSDYLFGHKSGAFTGAQAPLGGLIEKASEGTLFLDEIGDLSLASQVKLLRVIETGEFYPLGADSTKRNRSRVIVATNKDLARSSVEGAFRKDLFFRLKAHNIHIPPLRERMGDLPLLVDRFLTDAAKAAGRAMPEVPDKLYAFLSAYEFPGNVRELQAMVMDAYSRDSGRIALKSFRAAIGGSSQLAPSELTSLVFPSILPSIQRTVEALIAEAIKRSDGNQALAARLLGISPQALSMRLKKKKGENRENKLNGSIKDNGSISLF
jgi:DNA-binding NtrC family response regulator